MEEYLDTENNPKISAFELLPVLIPYFIGFFVFRGMFVNFPLYLQIKQNLTELQTVEIWAIISGVALLVGALTRVPAGLVSDRIGRVKAFFLAYSVYFIALILILLTTSTFLYIVALSIVRFGLNTIAMTGRSIVSTANRDRALKNGLLSSAVGLGSFSGPYLLGYILDNFAPDTIIYATITLISLDVLLFVIFYIGVNRWFQSSSHYDKDLSFDPVSKDDKPDILKALSHEGVGEILFLFFSAGMVFGMITQVYSIYGFNVLSMSTTLIGLVTGAGALVQTFWAPITGRLYEFIKDEYLRIIAWFLILVAGVSAVLSPLGRIFFILSFFILNFGNSTYFTMEITRMSKIIDRNEFSIVFGTASSLIILATSIAGFISNVLYKISPEANFYGALLMGSLSFILVLITTPKWKRKRKLQE